MIDTGERAAAAGPDAAAALDPDAVAAVDSDAAATLEELRALDLAADNSGRARLHGLFARMAAGQITPVAPGPPPAPRWEFEGHPACPRCACPPRSAGACLGPGCATTIASVHEVPPRWCSTRCRRRWYTSLPLRREGEPWRY